ncbi:MAG: NUDIX domain-containing protein [Chloroflexi bacterium]|nr:NUDIX domain-containing protein [Chloroflexota bacterium]
MSAPFELLACYPELAEMLDNLCAGAPWCVTGASALLSDGANWLFEITKPKHWRRRADGATLVGIGAIGGSLEAHEAILECLRREAREEIDIEIAPLSSQSTYLIYEHREVHRLSLPERTFPRPALLTISENLYRRHLRPECEILAIVTFLARLEGEPHLRDLFGLLTIPEGALAEVLGPDEIALSAVAALPGVRWQTREPLPENTVLMPVWTAQSLQVLIRSANVGQLGSCPTFALDTI